MKIYTKTGDQGSTSLLGGSRVPKYSLRIEAYGTIDELNSWIGLLQCQPENSNRQPLLIEIQNLLFSVGSSLAAEADSKFQLPAGPGAEEIANLEQAMDEMESKLEPLRNFILPGGHKLIAECHIARTVCRRAERRVVELASTEPVDEQVIIYLNRLSDYLFMLGRALTKELGAEEVKWSPKSKKV